MASFSLPAAPFLEEEIPSAVEMIASMQGSRAGGGGGRDVEVKGVGDIIRLGSVIDSGTRVPS
jgi:hypothetical protein